MLLMGLVMRKQITTPATIYKADGVCGIRGSSFQAAAAGEVFPEIMGPQDISPLPQGLPVFPSPGFVGAICQSYNMAAGGDFAVYVLVNYDIVTLTQSEQARLLY